MKTRCSLPPSSAYFLSIVIAIRHTWCWLEFTSLNTVCRDSQSHCVNCNCNNISLTRIITFDIKVLSISRKSIDYFAAAIFTHAHAHKLHCTSIQDTPLVYPLTTLSTPFCTRRQTSSRMILHAFRAHNLQLTAYNVLTHATDAAPMSQKYKITIFVPPQINPLSGNPSTPILAVIETLLSHH